MDRIATQTRRAICENGEIRGHWVIVINPLCRIRAVDFSTWLCMVALVAVSPRPDLHRLRANRAERCPIRHRSTYRRKGQDSGGEPNSGSHALPWGESGLKADGYPQ